MPRRCDATTCLPYFLPPPQLIMPGLDPGILFQATKKDRRVKPGEDDVSGIVGPSDPGQSLLEVRNQIIRMLDADRQPHEVVRHGARRPLHRLAVFGKAFHPTQ